VIGVGNPLMGDDGVGAEVAKSLRKLHLGSGVEILERQSVDLSILTYAREARKMVIVDAIKSGGPPGSVIRFDVTRPHSPSMRLPVAHESGVSDIAVLARRSGIRLPPIIVVGVEPADCSPGAGLSKAVAGALPLVLEEVTKEVKECAP